MFAAIMSAVPIASTGTLPRIRVDTATHFFTDDAGSAAVFHGVNAVEKLHPFLPVRHGFSIERSLSDGDVADLASWGFNVVRLGVLWTGTMPEPGHINQTYLEEAREIVRMLGRHGVYTLIDMHQDSMGARFCGEGFPDWAVRKALRLSGFNSSAPFHRFPAPFPWDMGIDPATGTGTSRPGTLRGRRPRRARPSSVCPRCMRPLATTGPPSPAPSPTRVRCSAMSC